MFSLKICCHPGLIKSMIDSESRANDGLIDSTGEGVDEDLISQMTSLSMNSSGSKQIEEEVKSVLHMENPVFQVSKCQHTMIQDYGHGSVPFVYLQQSIESSKINRIVVELKKLHKQGSESGALVKAVIVSQWTSMLEIVKPHVEKIGMKCVAINGIPFSAYAPIQANFIVLCDVLNGLRRFEIVWASRQSPWPPCTHLYREFRTCYQTYIR